MVLQQDPDQREPPPLPDRLAVAALPGVMRPLGDGCIAHLSVVRRGWLVFLSACCVISNSSMCYWGGAVCTQSMQQPGICMQFVQACMENLQATKGVDGP